MFEGDEEEWRIISIGRIGITSWVLRLPNSLPAFDNGSEPLIKLILKKTCNHVIPEISMSIKEPVPLVAVIPDARYKYSAICEWEIGRR